MMACWKGRLAVVKAIIEWPAADGDQVDLNA